MCFSRIHLNYRGKQPKPGGVFQSDGSALAEVTSMWRASSWGPLENLLGWVLVSSWELWFQRLVFRINRHTIFELLHTAALGGAGGGLCWCRNQD